MRAALYSRVSTDLQEKDQTIQSQIEALRDYAQDNGFEVVAEFEDEGYSGATLERPGLDRLRDALRSREFDVVLFHSPDRLARKAVYQGLVLEELDKAGVRVEFLNHPVDDSPEGKMLLGMQALFAEYERAKIAERQRRGKLYWAKQGALLGGYVPYGYRYRPRDRERNLRASLEVDEVQAAIVRDMYRWLLEERLSCRGIAKRLTELGVPTQKSKLQWKPSTVNRMLKNEAYKGYFYYHRYEAVEPTRSLWRSYPKHKLTGRRLRPRDEWIAIRVPAIVDEATWDSAQRQLHENFLHSPRHNIRHQYLLRGLVRCPLCGATYVGTFSHGRRYYRCNRIDPLASADRQRCRSRWVVADPLEEVVWQAVAEAFQQPRTLAEEYRRRLDQADTPDTVERERKQIEVALKRVEAQQDRITDAYANEAMELPQYKPKMDQLRERRRYLERQMADLEHRAEARERERDGLARLNAFCETVVRGLDNLTFRERQELLRLTVERVIVEDERVKVEAIVPLDDDSGGVPALRPQSANPSVQCCPHRRPSLLTLSVCS